MRPPKKLALCALACTLVGCSPAEPPGAAPASTTTEQPSGSVGAPGAGDPYYPNDGNGGYDALAYDVSVTYQPQRSHLEGDSTLRARATQPLTRFNLDLRGLTVRAVEVDGERAGFSRAGEFELVITPRELIREGDEFTVAVRYEGTPGQSSKPGVGRLGWLTTEDGAAYALGEPHSASFWYPVNDTPRDKARFRLTARVPKGWTAVSTGRPGKITTEDGWTTSTWEETNPVASYLTTIAVDKFSIDRSKLPSGIPVLSAYAPGAEDKRRHEARLAEIIAFLTEKFGPYPQTAAGGIYMAEHIPFALETQGRPTYAAWAELSVVVHEYAHQWYGNSVTIASWSDMCLNECFATYAGWMWDEAKHGADLDSRYLGEVKANAGSGNFWANKLHEMGSGNEFDGVYDKGALAIHALRHAVGAETFAKIIKQWPAEHRHSNASWRQFEEFVARAAGKDLGGFFDAWFRGTEMPDEEYLYPGKLAGTPR